MTYSPVLVGAQVWLRNPSFYIREALEVGADSFAWDRGFCRRRSLDPCRFINSFVGSRLPEVRSLLIGLQGSAEYGLGDKTSKPRAVYPTWRFGDDYKALISMVQHPAGEEPRRYRQDEPELCAVAGQEHRILIVDIPSVATPLVRKFLIELSEMQTENPQVIFHVHGLYSYRAMFGLDFRAVDIDPRTTAAQGKVYMPHGKEMTPDKAAQQPKWVNLLGMLPSDLRVPRNRCIFNILSAGWAAKHFRENIRWATKRGLPEFIDPDDPVSEVITDSRIMLRNGVHKSEGDLWLCNLCSLQSSCKFFREGAVCAVPESEPLELATFFGTRDSDTILEGLSTMLQFESRRLAAAADLEELDGDDAKVDPEVTKLFNTLFDRAVKFAKLVDPKLAAPRFNFKIDNRVQSINASTPQQLMAAAMNELVKRGIDRDKITPEMCMKLIEEGEDNIEQRAIDVAAAEKSA